MSFNLKREERDARVMLGTELNTTYDEISQGIADGKLDFLLECLGEIKEELAKNEYYEAEKSLRKLKKKVTKEFGEFAPKTEAIETSLDKIRKIMNRDLWTEPPSKNSEKFE